MKPDLVELEKHGWRALSTGQDAAREFYGPLLTEDTVMLFPGGLVLEGKKKILESMSAQPWRSFDFADTQVVRLSQTAEIIVYRVVAQCDGGEPYMALISSTYAVREGEWKLLVHQHTLA